MKKLDRNRTLIVIPVYNHGASLREVVSQAIGTGMSVLVVDDGSDDGGGQNLNGLDCRYLRLPQNRGKGAAILAGVQWASENDFAAIITVDADGQHNPADATKLVTAAMHCQWPVMIIGAREMVQETVPASSHFGRSFSNFWVRLECGAELSDTQSGLRLYPVKELLQLKLVHSRYDFEVEVIVKAAWAGIAIHEVPVSVHYPSADERVSHFKKFRDNWRLTKLHSTLFFRRLLPLPTNQLVKKNDNENKPVIVKNPIKTLKNLCREHASPFWLAVAVAMGLFLGALPLIGCHTVAIIYVAYRLHLNKVAAVAASQFCMPPIVPALCIEVGYFFQHGTFIVDLSWQKWLLEVHHRVYDWLLGSLVVGPLLGLLGGALVLWATRRMGMVRQNQAGE